MSRFGRRGFLIGSAAGGLAALLPWTRAHSQELPRPKRLVLFFTPHGTLFDSGRPTEKWLPTGTERDLTLHPLMESSCMIV